MKKLLEDIRRNTPKMLQGYNYLKTEDIFIPYMMINVECLIRKVSDLNLFFESVLKLVDLSVKETGKIAAILGVSESIIREAVVDMINADYLFASEGILSITNSGRKVLETKKRIEIQKIYIKDIAIDMITGTVYDGDSIIFADEKKRCVELEQIIDLDDNFFDQNFQEINRVYQTQQKNNSVFGDSAITRELYKIIGVKHSWLKHVENQLYIYKNEASDEVSLVFSKDTNDLYKNELYNQLKDSYRPCQEYFFEKDRNLIKEIKNDTDEYDIGKLNHTKNSLNMLMTNSIKEDNFTEYFQCNRYSFYDREYLSYLFNLKSLRYETIYISSRFLKKIFISPTFCSQIKALSQKIQIFIAYDRNEWGVDKALKYFFGKSDKNIHLVEQDYVEDDVICFGSEIMATFKLRTIDVFEKPILYWQTDFTFERKVVSDKVDYLCDKYNLKQHITQEHTFTKNRIYIEERKKNGKKTLHNRSKRYRDNGR